MKEQMVKVYTSLGSYNRAGRKFQKDAKRLAKQGWMVQSQSTTRSHGLFTPMQASVTVVYTRG